MSQGAFRGVFTIPSTPFDRNGDIEWGDLKRVIDFCVDCGAHGIVWPVNASGFPVLTDEERLQGMRVIVEQTAGQIPVILGVQGVSGHHAAMFSRRAQELKADGVIAMAPYVQELEDEGALVQYFQVIDREVDVPIFIQNHARGSVLSIDTMVRLLNEVEHVEYIKEETFPVTHVIMGLIEQAGPKLKGVFGGAGDRYLLFEHPRGVVGQMRRAIVGCVGGWRFEGSKTSLWDDGTIVRLGDFERHVLSRSLAETTSDQKFAQSADDKLSNSGCIRS